MKETRFKNTELGPIPVDWEVATLGEIADFPTNTIETNKFASIKYVGTENMLQSCGGITPFDGELIYSRVREYKETDVLTSNIRPYLKKTWLSNCNAGCSTDVIVIRPKDRNIIIPQYVYLICSSNNFFDYSMNNSIGTKMPRANKKALIEYPVAIPSVIEQEKIAEALSDVDALIAELGELIEKKRLVKQGTMQQLLTASRRLPGFSKPWVEKELGKIGTTYSGLSGKTKEDFGVGDSKYITFLNVLTNPRIRTDLFEPVSVGIEEKQNKAEKGDLFFNTSSETPEEVGICSYLDEDIDDLYLNSFCFGYRINDSKVYPLYLAYFFRSGIGRELMSMMAQGVTRYNISKSAFNKASIFIPSDIAEQRAIAEILTDMDNEIAELEAKREKYRAIKDGMMQQLLTGRIRLIDPTASTDSATSVASSNPAGVSPHAPVITYEPTTAYPQSLAAEP